MSIELDGSVEGIVANPKGVELIYAVDIATPDDLAELYRIKGVKSSIRIRREDDDGSLPGHDE